MRNDIRRRSALIAAACVALPACLAAQETRRVTAPGNPILADDNYYSTDPAPLVADGKLYILAGRDEAPADVNDFIMHEWQMLETGDPASGQWTHRPDIARPETIFAWAEPSRAYAAQIVRGPDKLYYLYAPIMQKESKARDRFSIGVAVSDKPTGPWRDAHPAGPIVSQLAPEPNDIHNIDPTVLVDDDGRVWMYWGSFGKLRGVELERDMVTPKGRVFIVDGLTGYFEAPWVMKRNGTYYMLYAGNNAGPASPCTPAVYYACYAYGTAPDPKGPWTYRGVLLKPVSSTTSHGGVVEFKGKWYLAYHTADAESGGHFRRSVALDRVEWDDSVSPPAIRLVTPTRRPQPAPLPTRNIAASATAAASNEPIPVQYWIKALNDGIAKANPLPPDMWGSWTPDNPKRQWVEYRWRKPVTVNGSRIWFWADQPAGAGIGVAPPASWRIEYWDGGWKAVAGASGYGTATGAFQDTAFAPITTRCLRAVFDASSPQGTNAGVAVQEWQVLVPQAAVPTPPSATAAPPCN
jgi:hypothetical protein